MRYQLKNVGQVTHLVDSFNHNRVIRVFTPEDGDLAEEIKNEYNHSFEIKVDLHNLGRELCLNN